MKTKDNPLLNLCISLLTAGGAVVIAIFMMAGIANMLNSIGSNQPDNHKLGELLSEGEVQSGESVINDDYLDTCKECGKYVATGMTTIARDQPDGTKRYVHLHCANAEEYEILKQAEYEEIRRGLPATQQDIYELRLLIEELKNESVSDAK